MFFQKFIVIKYVSFAPPYMTKLIVQFYIPKNMFEQSLKQIAHTCSNFILSIFFPHGQYLFYMDKQHLNPLFFLNACLSHWSYFINKFVQLLIGSSLFIIFLIAV